MVGKPNLSDDGYNRPDLRGAATRTTPGLTALDEEREASMADEGGAAGMLMESEDESAVPTLSPIEAHGRRQRLGRALLIGAGVGAALVFWSARRHS